MSVTDVTSRISQIQTQLASFGTTATATTASDFSRLLQTASAGATGETTASTSTDGGVSGEAVVEEAKKYLGVPYVWGGTDPKKGLDCSGLVQLVYRNLGHELPRVSYQQAEAGRPVASLAEAQPGDILAFGSPVHHVGLYVGDGKMIEAPRTGLDVRITDVYETPTAIRRVLPEGGVSATTGLAGPTSGRTVTDVPYADLFNAAAARYGLDPSLLSAVARQESGYRADAVSPAGAQGLMQLMPGTARGLGVTDSFDPTQAVDGAARLLSDLLDRFGRTDLALAAYNAGPGAVLRYDGIPPYRETQNYVRSVMSMLQAAA